MQRKRLITIFSLISLLALVMLILSMSYFGAEGFRWFEGFVPDSEKAKDSIALTTWSLVVVGIGLSIAGTAMQGVTRNTLASAYSLGTVASATLAIIIVDYILDINNPFLGIFLILIISTSISSLLLLISFSPKVSPSRVIIIGMIVSIFLSSITYILKISYNLTGEMISFLALDTFTMTWEKFTISTPIILVFTIFLLVIAKQIQIYESDPEKALTLGIKARHLRFYASLSTIFIASSAVYLVGPITFIGILVPQLARMILKNQASTHKIMFLSIPLSIAILLLAQILTRNLFRFGLTINVIIAVISGPLIIYKIVRGNYA